MVAGAKPLHDELERLMKQSSFNFENFANAKESDILSPNPEASELDDIVAPLQSAQEQATLE